MSLTTLALWFIVGLLIFWVFGGIVARLGGLLFLFAGIADLALAPNVSAFLPIAMGGLIWLTGHWHFALRHHEYKSPLARYVFCRWAPRWVDPTRNWAVAVASERSPGEGRGR